MNDLRRVLITGATGFIGGYLVRECVARGLDVTALVRRKTALAGWDQKVRVAVGDLSQPGSLGEAVQGVNTVLHLAGKAHALAPRASEVAEYEQVNTEGTRNLIDAATAAGAKRFVLFSSVKATDDTPYGISKRRAEELVLAHGVRTGIHVVCLRLSLVYGAGAKGNLEAMMHGIDRGYFPPIADVQNRRSMVHVSNVVQAALLAADNPAANGKRYVVTDRAPYSTRELYEGMCRALGRPVPRWTVPLPALRVAARVGDVIGRARRRRFAFDSAALEKLVGTEAYTSEEIQRELGYRPEMTLAEALPSLAAAYREGKR